jgi:hypothetical protein
VASANAVPVIDAPFGATALDEDIPRVLRVEGASSIEELGWTRPNRLTLLIPMRGVRAGVTDDFLLRLGFQAYRRWPPSAQFVNPQTLGYAIAQDQYHVPKLTGPECQTHVAYAGPRGPVQLVCCSATLEFYEVQHHVDPHHVWRETNTFFTTLTAIRKAFVSHYQGRFP